MSVGMFQLVVPSTLRTLTNLRAILAKAAAHCETRKIDPLVLTRYRLFPDMLPLTFQIQVACDIPKGAIARLAGVEAPKLEDKEQSFGELQERIDKTISFIQTVSASQVDGTETKPITLKTPRGDLNFEGLSYVQGFVLPNLYFHATTAYNILRHNGVELGKMDFLGKP